MTIGSLFSGIGGLELGLERAGLGPVVWQVETDPFCRSVLAKHWPNADRSVTDVCEAGARNLAPVDVICGGFPCQDLSYAGKGAGLGGVRSGLWFEYARIVGELRPRVVVVENIAALATRGLDVVLGTLADLGYDAVWTTVRASDVGHPHRRERLFIVAHQFGSRLEVGASERGDAQPQLASTEQGCVVAHDDSRRRLRACPEQAGRADANTQPGDESGNGGEGIVGDASPQLRTEQGLTSHERRRPSRRQAFARLGLPTDGLSRRVAGPSGAQHDWEAPRTTEGCQDRAAKLKALGNAVVPQVAEVVGWIVRGLMP